MKIINIISLLIPLAFTSLTQAQSVNQEELVNIKLAGPAAVISYPLMVMAQQQVLANEGVKLSFTRWKNPDQLRAMVVGGQVDFTAMPSNLAATFYNKGHKLSLLNIAIWDIMSVVSQATDDAKLNSLEQLVGQEIVVPFKNDMPNIVLQQLLNAQLGEKANQVAIRQSHNLADAAQLLLAGQVKHALLIEPLTSIVLFQSKQQGKTQLLRGINISEQWQRTFPQSPKLPQAGIVANTSVNKQIQLVEQINSAYKKSAIWCSKNPSDCADIAKKYLAKMPKPALISAINNTGLDVLDAKKARLALEAFYQLLEKSESKRIGGQLPDDGFYWQ